MVIWKRKIPLLNLCKRLGTIAVYIGPGVSSSLLFPLLQPASEYFLTQVERVARKANDKRDRKQANRSHNYYRVLCLGPDTHFILPNGEDEPG